MLSRRAALVLPLVAAACGTQGPPRDLTPPQYGYLTPLPLNVATIEYAPLPPPGPLADQSPLAAGPALLQLARDRLSAGGSAGRAVVTVQEAQVTRAGGGLDGVLALRLDLYAGETVAAFAEARVVRRSVDPDTDLRTALFDITKAMLDDMNVELEFQVRRSLRDYLQSAGPAPTPASVQQQDLSARRP